MHWTEQRDQVRSLPLPWRLYAAYARACRRPVDGRLRGGSFLLRQLARLAELSRNEKVAAVTRRGAGTLFVDLKDRRAPLVFAEFLDGACPERDFVEANLRAGDSFIDVGANHGSFSLVAASAVGPGGRVVAIEPQSRLAALVARSARASGHTNIEVFPLACGEAEGSAEVMVPRAGSGGAGVFPGHSGAGPHRTEAARMIPLDSILDGVGLPGDILLKIDAEGSELSTLRGARQLLEERGPRVLFEAHPAAARAAGTSVEAIVQFLRGLGFTLFDLPGYPGRPLAPAAQVGGRTMLVAARA